MFVCKIDKIAKMDKTLDKNSKICKSSLKFCDSSFTLGDDHQSQMISSSLNVSPSFFVRVLHSQVFKLYSTCQ